jgi:hypothetical protein
MPENEKNWRRDTAWRQGSVLCENATALANADVEPDTNGKSRLVVISHDCDIANENLAQESHVEVIVGKLVEKNGNYLHGKNARKLHLPFTYNDEEVFIEFEAHRKRSVSKNALVEFQPAADFSLKTKDLGILRQWLAARYRRSAFPDEFDRRMSSLKITDQLYRVLSKYGAVISAVYFNLDDGAAFDRSSDSSIYELTIVLAYLPGNDADKASEIGDKASEEISDFLERVLYDSKVEKWNGIQLINCIAISEDDLTVSQARALSQWNSDHISLRESDHPLPL